MSEVRVLVVDDDPLVRSALSMLLDGANGIRVVGEAGDGAEVPAALDAHPVDVVLMDLRMPVMDGTEATARITAEADAPHVLVLTTYDTDADIVRAVEAGARGYLLKDAATGELELALRSVMRGASWLSPAVSRQVVEGYVQRVGGDAAPEVLTARQREVLKLVAGGKSTKEIAFLLNLSVKTVETHRAQIMERLGIRDVAGLVRYALRTGLIPPEG